MLIRRSARERPATALTLKPVRVQAREIGWRVNEPAVRTLPGRNRDVVPGFAGHDRAPSGGAGSFHPLWMMPSPTRRTNSRCEVAGDVQDQLRDAGREAGYTGKVASK